MRMRGWYLAGALVLAAAGCAQTKSAGREAGQTAEAAGQKTGEFVSDSWITGKIKTQYGIDRDIKASNINVDTAGGVVTLTGVVSSPYVAQKAIQEALDTRGVVEVRSNLHYPTAPMQVRIFHPGERVRF